MTETLTASPPPETQAPAAPADCAMSISMRDCARASMVEGRWVCQITGEAPDSDTENEVPEGFYDCAAGEKPTDCDLTEGEEEPAFPAKAGDWQYDQLVLQRDAEGKLVWMMPAKWENYDVDEQTSQLGTCADTLKASADAMDAMLAALRLAENKIVEAMESHIYDHDDTIPEDCSYTAALATIRAAIARAEVTV